MLKQWNVDNYKINKKKLASALSGGCCKHPDVVQITDTNSLGCGKNTLSSDHLTINGNKPYCKL